MSTLNNKPIAPLSNPVSPPRPQTSAPDINTVTGNSGATQVPPSRPRAAGGGNLGLTPRLIKTETAEPARAASVEAQWRQKAQDVVLAADKCLNDVMVALTDGDFKGVPKACKAVAKALAPIVDRRAKKAEDDSMNAEAATRKAAESSKKSPDAAEKAVKAARKLASFRQELGIDAKTPGIVEFTADACGDRLHHQLPKLKDGQLAVLNENLEKFLVLAKGPQKGSSPTSAPEDVVPHQLQFSVKAELLNRMMQKNKDSSDAGTISKFTKDELVELRDLTTSLDRMARSGTPAEATLPGTRFTLTRIRDIDQLAQSRLGAILTTEGAIARVEGAEKRLKGNDLAQLKRLKGAVDFLVTNGVKLTNVSLVQLQKDVGVRIQQVEQAKADALITPEMRKGPSGTFKAKLLSDEVLMKLMGAFLLEDDLTPELEDAKKEVEDILNMRRSNVAADFSDALLDALDAAGTAQSMMKLLKSMVVAEKSLATFNALNWDKSDVRVSQWMGDVVRGPKQPAKRVGPNPFNAAEVAAYVVPKNPEPKLASVPPVRDREGMVSLLDDLTSGDGRIIRDLLAASQVDVSGPAVAYLDLLTHTFNLLLGDRSTPSTPRAVKAADLTPAGLAALQSTLNLTVKSGRLVEFKAVAQPTTTPRPQKS
ncbi:hypothetical protein [Hydrogenophaga sp. 2FB]|uniref:hypothetical protein n=1 Tax=Hydrogenophaga sp. 2FB TaxID=2502187 RepID=UPI0010F9A779|nr:hypothetical protein [Hydrogenophaga sp. 2FB]